MSTGPFPPAREEERSVSVPSFRSSQRKMLHLLLERNASFTARSDFPGSPGDKLLDLPNLSILSGGTPKRCLDLSNLSNGELSASQLTASADFDETGSLDSSGPQDAQLTAKNHHQDLMKGIPVQLLCSTPNALDHGHRKKDAMRDLSANKENINTNLKTLEWEAPRTPRFRKLPGEPLASPLPVLENRIMVENEMRYLGSPITTVPKRSQNLKLEDQEGISEEPMEFSLEDQGTKSLSLKKMAPLCDINAIQMEEEESEQGYLIGDFSKVCVLPTVSGKHQDLKYVTPDTVADLLSGKFQDLVEKFYIIDCRYPYEYLGGHILGALNLCSQKELHEFFLKKPIVPLDGQKRIIIVFLCEFSSERGPRMCRSLREKDRALNQYPALYYPELYILKGGYRDFFPEYMELCEPQSYCPMHHQDHQAELLRWRSQSKAQEGERQLWEQIAVLVKDVRP
ncbi:M-phase inducer phosphatase 3 isoform X1 [Alexandromys fortis]|uniref:M-phase inducer phosphatase 3 isoform X1 n=3 Tax=Alexandromys fortis TaxID=100897 RepID=UPI00215323B4|nr:M-phase inducer phosphatase 3 isoform X1 [Microtus fortis]XP_049990771.1 M-phase inducer phosphatase 3 isoform X1 [Microtus fortis]XP_049990772.1 M-phase inducer phosphatase 3 isoform X1 [Microtus fortis]